MKFKYIATGAVLLASTVTLASAQERVVMPDRQSIEVSGQIAALKSLLEEALRQNATLSQSMTEVLTLSEAQQISITSLELALMNVSNNTSTTTITQTPTLSDADAWGNYKGRTINCTIRIRDFGEVTAYARVTSAGVPQTKWGSSPWVNGYTSQFGNANWYAQRGADGYYVPSALSASGSLSRCVAWGGRNRVCTRSEYRTGSCTANW